MYMCIHARVDTPDDRSRERQVSHSLPFANWNFRSTSTVQTEALISTLLPSVPPYNRLYILCIYKRHSLTQNTLDVIAAIQPDITRTITIVMIYSDLDVIEMKTALLGKTTYVIVEV